MIPARDSSAVYWYSGQRTVIRDMSFQIPENKGTKSFKATFQLICVSMISWKLSYFFIIIILFRVEIINILFRFP